VSQTTKAAAATGLSGLLAARVAAGDDQARIVRDLDGERESATLAQVHASATRIAGALAARDAPGARVLLALPSGPQWYAAFFGCLYARCIPVPVPALRGGRRLARIGEVILACGATRAICPEDCADNARRLALRFDPLDERCSAPAMAPLPAAADEVAYLQFTSGSTGEARGAMISHRAALANVEALNDVLRPPAGAWHASWLPLHHDMGLLMTLAALVDCGGVALLAPEEFALEPWRWLDLISRWRACRSGGPNFAYDQLARARAPAGAAPLDLNCWQVAFCGAEAVRPNVMRRFARRFAASGFRAEALKPGYGMSEFTLLASIVPPGRAAVSMSIPSGDGRRPLEISEVGPIVPGHRLLIVDPQTQQPLPDGATGEVWLDGPSKATGYWGREEESRPIFRAGVAGCGGEFLRTGDLGFLRDGNLYIVGRLKERIILRGRNLHPSQIEDAVLSAHPALRAPAAAFIVEARDSEALGVACEVKRGTPAAQHAAILAAIQRELGDRLGITAQSLALLRAGSAPRTTSGKLRRLACRQMLDAGELRALARWDCADVPLPEPAGAPPDAARIRAWIARWVAARHALAEDAIDPQRPLQDFGLDSMEAIELVYALEDWLHLPLDAALLWRTGTLQALAEHLEAMLHGRPQHTAEPPVPGTAIEGLLDGIAQLSDEDVEAQFERRIRSRTT
jgi:acyl-CoA synthetase (AMP-forming)/AMP-acid ligase II/acyl carrier protein